MESYSSASTIDPRKRRTCLAEKLVWYLTCALHCIRLGIAPGLERALSGDQGVSRSCIMEVLKLIICLNIFGKPQTQSYLRKSMLYQTHQRR